MYIFLAVIAILFLIFEAVSIRAKNGSRIYKPTKRDIEKEADEKYNRISGRMQQKLLRKRKSIKPKRGRSVRENTRLLFFLSYLRFISEKRTALTYFYSSERSPFVLSHLL